MTISLPAPFTGRPGRPDDLPALVELLNAHDQHYLGFGTVTLDEMHNEWTSPGFDPARDARLVFTPDGQLVGHIEVWHGEEPPVHPHIWGHVHPAWEGCGIGRALLAWAEQHARSQIDRCPPDARVALRTHKDSRQQPARKLLEANGYRLIRHYFRMRIEMDAPPPAPRWPEGIRLRQADPERELEAIYRTDQDAFRDHFGFLEQPFETGLAQFRHNFLETENYDPTLWFVAQADDQIAGICLCRPHSWDDPASGYVSSLGVRREWRNRGIGLALLQHAFGEFYRRGLRAVELGVDADNLTGALRLYRKAGMQVKRRIDLFEKELRPGREYTVQG